MTKFIFYCKISFFQAYSCSILMRIFFWSHGTCYPHKKQWVGYKRIFKIWPNTEFRLEVGFLSNRTEPSFQKFAFGSTKTKIRKKNSISAEFYLNFASSFFGLFKVEIPEINTVSMYNHLISRQFQWQILCLGKVIWGEGEPLGK